MSPPLDHPTPFDMYQPSEWMGFFAQLVPKNIPRFQSTPPPRKDVQLDLRAFVDVIYKYAKGLKITVSSNNLSSGNYMIYWDGVGPDPARQLRPANRSFSLRLPDVIRCGVSDFDVRNFRQQFVPNIEDKAFYKPYEQVPY